MLRNSFRSFPDTPWGFARLPPSTPKEPQGALGRGAVERGLDAETALEKATASRGLLAVEPNEADLYGYTDELEDACNAFKEGRDALLPWSYGLEITKLCIAGYMSGERKKSIDLSDPAVQKELETFVPLIAQGKGAEVLF